MASFSKLIEGKTPLYDEIIAHAKLSDKEFILPNEPVIKNCDKNITRNLKALYFSISRSEQKDLFLGDLYKMILPNCEIKNYFDFFNFVGMVILDDKYYDKRLIDEIAMSSCYFCRYSPDVAPIKFALMGLAAVRMPRIYLEKLGIVNISKLYDIFLNHSNISEFF